jgi:protease-4
MRKVFLGIFLGLLLAVVLGIVGVVGLVRMAGKGGMEVASNSLLVLDWGGSLPGHQIPLSEADLGAPVTLSRVLEALREAAGRDEIQGLLIEDDLQLPREYLTELAGAVEAFRQAGKPVWAHVELGYGNSYLAACLADTLALSPGAGGGLLLPGPRVSRLYMADALRRLGVKVNVLHQGEAKGYGEEYVRQEMSPAVRENLSLLVEDLLTEELGWIGQRRGLDPAILGAQLRQPGEVWLSPGRALELGLADTLLSRTDFHAAVEARWPGHARLSLSEWIRSRPQPPVLDKGVTETRDHVAVLWAEGEIVPGMAAGGSVQIRSDEMIREIRDLRESDAVKAVVLRVESPGGSALASEEIYQELVKLAASKPLWVSAGPVAASGGYYLSVPGARLWASPTSVMGSIGVVALVPDLSGSAAKLGLSSQGIHPLPAGRLGDLGGPVDPATLASMEARLGEVYAEFRSRVLTHRPLDEAGLARVDGGRVWSGRRAHELGLVDQLGTLAECLDSLQAGLGGGLLPVAHYPAQENLLSLLLSGRLRFRDLLPLAGGATWRESLLPAGAAPWLRRLEEEPARLADPSWMLRAEDRLLLP